MNDEVVIEVTAGHIGTPFDTSEPMPGDRIWRTDRQAVEAEASRELERWVGVGRHSDGRHAMSDEQFSKFINWPKEKQVGYALDSIGMSKTDDLQWDVVEDILPQLVDIRAESEEKMRTKKLERVVREALDDDVAPGVDPAAGFGMDDSARPPRGVKIHDYDAHSEAWQAYSDTYKYIYGMRPRVDLSDYTAGEIEALIDDMIASHEEDLELQHTSADPLGDVEPDEYYDPREDMPMRSSMSRRFEAYDRDVAPGVNPAAGMRADIESRPPRNHGEDIDWQEHGLAWDAYNSWYKRVHGERPRGLDLSDYTPDEIWAMVAELAEKERGQLRSADRGAPRGVSECFARITPRRVKQLVESALHEADGEELAPQADVVSPKRSQLKDLKSRMRGVVETLSITVDGLRDDIPRVGTKKVSMRDLHGAVVSLTKNAGMMLDMLEELEALREGIIINEGGPDLMAMSAGELRQLQRQTDDPELKDRIDREIDERKRAARSGGFQGAR